MLSVSEAQAKLLAALAPTDSEIIPIGEAHRRVLAEPLVADRPSPAFDNSSMDGFAVRAEDLRQANGDAPAMLKVIGDIPAGHFPSKGVGAGQAMRIMTGAPMPAGADAVVPVEDTDAEKAGADAPLPQQVGITRRVESGDFVRPAGQDFEAGETLIAAGRRLAPQDVAMLAMLGRGEVPVHRRPKVALFSSGDELIPPGEELAPGQIYESNSFSLAAALESCHAEILRLGIAPDNLTAIQGFLDRAVESDADLILSSAGVSVGAYDYLREALTSAGELDFWRVNMRPGKPLAFGSYRGVPYIGLPGNPVSALVSFEVFGRQALNHMSGEKDWQRLSLVAALAEDVRSDGRQSYLRARFERQEGGLFAHLTGHQGSGNLYSLVQAQGLVVVPAGAKSLKAGSSIEAWPLNT